MSDKDAESLSAGLSGVRIESSGYDSVVSHALEVSSNSGSGSGSGSAPPQRKADQPYQFLVLATRQGPCKPFRTKIPVTLNFIRMKFPHDIKYRSFRLDWMEYSKNSWVAIKKEKMTMFFTILYKRNRNLFPSNGLVFNGTDVYFTHIDYKLPSEALNNYVEFNLSDPRPAGRDGRSRAPGRGRVKITPLPMVTIIPSMVHEEGLEHKNLEEVRCALMQFADCVISQEHRFDLTGQAQRFVQHGHSLFKIPTQPGVRNIDVVPIGMGQEVWLGLHTAVKTDAAEIFLNADTSGSIFWARELNLVQFYAQVLNGYNVSKTRDIHAGAMIEPSKLKELAFILKGKKLNFRYPDGSSRVKKFDSFGPPAETAYFNLNGRKTSVTEYFLYQHNYRLSYPNFPVLAFANKANKLSVERVYFPFELFYTLGDAEKYKGQLSDRQLDAFIKAVCQDPIQKQERILRMCASGGDYLGNTALMKDWGISIERELVQIPECVVLPVPRIEMSNNPEVKPKIEDDTCAWSITDEFDKPIRPLEAPSKRIIFCVTFLNRTEREALAEENQRPIRLMVAMMKNYGLNVDPDFGTFYVPQFYGGQAQYGKKKNSLVTGDGYFREHVIEATQQHVARRSAETGEECIAQHMVVFPSRHAGAYGAIKYACDVIYGVPNQCILERTFVKFTGSAITNSSAQNVLLKMLAKLGAIQYRVSAAQHRNMARMQDPEDPVIILAIDVSHPGREERGEAIEKHQAKTGVTTKQLNMHRGQHEKLPSARPAAAGLFQGMSHADCPRSVMSVVGSIDIKGTRFRSSARVQRLGQEETVNLQEPFKERINEFIENTGVAPKHCFVYRDGASDTQVKKIGYEEMEALKSALDGLGIKEECTITYITAVKRHHTRFFRSDLDQFAVGMPNLNCPPGTLVESVIVSKSKFDFYLQSHYGTIGTASPTRYTVVHDDWQVSPSFIQTVIYAHCYGNLRCTKPLSIPVMLHYAHLSAKRAKVHYDRFAEYPPEEYITTHEDLIREEMERQAVTPHDNLRKMMTMHYM